jgi:excisionase family DNA binding protein
LSIKEAAETFGLSRATIYRPIEQKKLATLKIGARHLVRFHERYRPCRIDPTLSNGQTVGSRGCDGGRFTLDASRSLTRAPRLLTLAL